MDLFRGIQEYIARYANNIALVFDSGNIVSISGNIFFDEVNIVSISGNIFLYSPQGHLILYNYYITLPLGNDIAHSILFAFGRSIIVMKASFLSIYVVIMHNLLLCIDYYSVNCDTYVTNALLVYWFVTIVKLIIDTGNWFKTLPVGCRYHPVQNAGGAGKFFPFIFDLIWGNLFITKRKRKKSCRMKMCMSVYGIDLSQKNISIYDTKQWKFMYILKKV